MERRLKMAKRAAVNALYDLRRAKGYADPGDGSIDRAIESTTEYIESLPKDETKTG